MDHDRFADLTKRLAATRSRREAAGLLAGGAAASALALLGGAERAAAADAPEPAFRFCRFPGTPCRKDRQCCTRKCKSDSKVCDCTPKGGSCFQNFGFTCCSGKCRNGKCR